MKIQKYSYCLFLVLTSFIFFITDVNAALENKSNLLFLEYFFFKKQKYILFLIFFLPSIYIFKNRKLLSFTGLLFLQIFVIVYWTSIIIWLRDLAGDSLSEMNTSNIHFILSWFNSIFNYLEPNLKLESFSKYYLIGFIFYFSFKVFKKKQEKYLKNFSLILSFIFIILFLNFNINHLFVNISTQKDVKKNITNSNRAYLPNNDINLIIFIGESNSTLNSDKFIKDIIGKNRFKKKGKFQYFQNIYSSHTHSTPSLLRLFSIANTKNEEDLLRPITDQKRKNFFSFIDNKIKKTYISTTHIEGYNNIHYSIFFKDFENQFFLKDSTHKFEREFFEEKLNNIDKLNDTGNLIVLHSSVGHAPYQKFIPGDYIAKNNTYNNEDIIKLTGNKNKILNEINDYNKALKYNYDNLENIISSINDNKPTVFIFLSDHGESIFTGNGHDSSRLVHEMLRVPFLIFYNNKFIEKYSQIINLHKKFNNKIYTTDILKEIIFNVYSLSHLNKEHQENYNSKFNKIIFQRNKNKTIELIDLNYNRVELPDKFSLKNENDTSLHVLSSNLDKKKICYHAANTIARIKRALQITSCLEVDLVISADDLHVYHPPSKNIYFSFDEFLEQSNESSSLWIDAKNINNVKNCKTLLKKIKNLNLTKKKILVEFPSNTKVNDPYIISCINEMRSINIQTSYYIPDFNKCYNDLNLNNINCQNLISKISMIDKNNNFNNISFDYKFSKILNKLNYQPINLKFNTWHLDFNDVKSLNLDLYNLIIPYNENHNRNTF